MRPARALLIPAVLCALVACRNEQDAIRGEVELLAAQDGEMVQAAAERVARRGRQALPAIESALHSANDRGRKNLILALRRIGDGDAIPLLRHVALYDEAEDVRREAVWTLQTWAAGKDARAERARAALRELDERRSREEAG